MFLRCLTLYLLGILSAIWTLERSSVSVVMDCATAESLLKVTSATLALAGRSYTMNLLAAFDTHFHRSFLKSQLPILKF